MEASLRAQFLDVERAVAKSMGERLAGADALIARLSAENARLEKENAAIPHLSSENMRLQQENAKHQRTLERLRELALADKP